MDISSATVAVVIPAYNAARTIDRTLLSVRAQTHDSLEILVVVDGATDDTETLARRHAAADRRIQVVVTKNQGVAAARNTGAAQSTGAFIAPIDADDLWHPDRIRRQLAIFSVGGSRMGCVYSPFRKIDLQDSVISNGAVSHFSGPLFLRSLYCNFVGNGSGLLIRRQAFEEVGGYETELRAIGLEGAEDKLIQILLARRWLTGVAPDYLIGYRSHQASMSRDSDRLIYSVLAALDIVARRHPDTPRVHLQGARAVALARLSMMRLRTGRLPGAIRAFDEALRFDPIIPFDVAFCDLKSRVRRRLRLMTGREMIGGPFSSYAPSVGHRSWSERPLQALLRRLEPEEWALYHGVGKVQRRAVSSEDRAPWLGVRAPVFGGVRGLVRRPRRPADGTQYRPGGRGFPS